MQSELTGQIVLQHFVSCCKKRNKLFVPDSPRQEQVCDAIASFYDQEVLIDAIDEYVKANPGPFIIFDFAIQSKKYIDHVITEKKSRDTFINMVQQTKKRMEQ
jgi:hypothetical protein